ncbi:HD domain-containing protein [Pyrococcus abyssi]|uniref:Metal-dependent phosphohydrolase, HD superfamily n=1 Tax=Pyrococcus abyssi (strain GE5 / Orsay) TaxID=272844 RepID=Q9V1T1_PYRAB|nr:HD domain-containing protein [Pyrococcus abyssi]CAB49268.1 metal-dependent phosphohydrolase, puative, containing HD region [Pyrococcus abyssi GE5]CCE69723.1 TPA: Metal-dependent phosphohydrolase, HD superfamily [Pyrococcus abyssi GE5]
MGIRVSDGKIIHDAVHGSMKVPEEILKLVDTPEFQRLRGVKQLGLANLVYPGANHTRFEHSLGTWYLAKKLSQELNLHYEESLLIQLAALLHDIGHGPFSHTFERIYRERLKFQDHMEVSKAVLEGKLEMCEEGGEIPDIINSLGYEPREIGDLIIGKHEKKYLRMIIHGDIDVDQLDYLTRDAHYTGVAHGIIDLERLLMVMKTHNNELVIDEKGIEAVEGMLVARSLMYSRVYFHRTVKIAEGMLIRALEFALDEGQLQDFWRMTDDRLIIELEDLGDYAGEIVRRIRSRRLYKAAVVIGPENLTSEEKKVLAHLYRSYKKRRKIENELAEEVGAKEGDVIIELSIPELILSEPRLKQVEVNVMLSSGKLEPIAKVTPLASAIKRRQTPRWILLIATLPEHVEKIKNVWREIVLE